MDLEYNNNMCPHHKSFKIYNNGKKKDLNIKEICFMVYEWNPL